MNKRIAVNWILLMGAIFGLTSVMLGAYVDHALALTVSEHSLKSLATALRYQQVHAVVICMLGLALSFHTNSSFKCWLQWSAMIFIAGILLFSFDIYASVIFDVPQLMRLVPTGGMMLMLGWVILIRAAMVRS